MTNDFEFECEECIKCQNEKSLKIFTMTRGIQI